MKSSKELECREMLESTVKLRGPLRDAPDGPGMRGGGDWTERSHGWGLLLVLYWALPLEAAEGASITVTLSLVLKPSHPR